MSMLAAGIKKHSDIATVSEKWQPADVVVIWSGRQENPPWHDGPVLRLDGGLLHADSGDFQRDRLSWISTGWNGVAGEADPLPIEVDGSRWAKLADTIGIELAEPFELPADQGHILLCRQHPGDRAAAGADFDALLAECNAVAMGTNYAVSDRLHPIIARRNAIRQPPLGGALEGCVLCVTFSSTSAVEAVVRGVPTVALSPKSAAYEVAAHSLEEPWTECANLLSEREPWAHRLAWQQWTHDELRDGTAWEFLKRCLDAQSAN